MASFWSFITLLFLTFGDFKTVSGNCSGGVTSQTVSYGESGLSELMLPSVIKPLTCTWEVRTNTNGLLIDLENFIIPESDYCEQGNLQITVGEYGKFDSVSLDKWCGEFYPRSLRLSGHVIIQLNLQHTKSRVLFKLRYTSILPSEFCPMPVRNYTGSGYIYSPGYGGHWTVSPMLSCEWQIEADPGHVVQVEIIHVDFSEWACLRQQAKLIAYDGNALLNEVGRWCTSEVLNVVKSARSGLHLTYINRVPHRGTGFYLKYYQVPDYHIDCAPNVRDVVARRTPSFINTNNRQTSCRWNITAEKENDVVVMETEYYDFGTVGCSYVDLRYFEGPGVNQSSLQRQLCSGTQIPSYNVIQSSGRHVFLDLRYNFVSRFVQPARSLIRVYSEPADPCWKSHRTYIADESKSRVWIPINSSTQNSGCDVRIHSSAADSCIKINISTKSGDQLSIYDFFQVYDGFNTSATMYESRCSTKGKSYTYSTGSTLFLVRQLSPLGGHLTLTDVDGFWLEYSSDSSCDIADYTVINADVHVTEYLPFPVPPTNNVHLHRNLSQLCNYVITTSSRYVIQLYLSDHQMVHLPESDCSGNTAFISDGIEGQNEIGWWCSGRGNDYVSRGNKIYITYMQKVNATQQNHRPTVYYRPRAKVQCGQSLSAPEGSALSISSPFYPKFYPNHVSCSWTITASRPNYRVEVRVTDISADMGPSSNCTEDFVAFHDGPSNTYPEIKRYCGQEVDRRPLRSSGQKMNVEFHSNDQITTKGFQASYKSVKLYKCNETLLAPDQNGRQEFLSSPYFPSNYGKNMNCYWLLETSENHLIQTEMALAEFTGSHSVCSGDRLTFYNGKDETAPVIGRVCGTELPKYRSSGRHMYIVFQSNNDIVTARGFQLQYYSVFLYRNCGSGNVGRLHGNTTRAGTLSSPFYPMGFPGDLTCQWRISVTHGYQVVVTVDRSDLVSDCNNFQVTFYDGPLPKSNILGTWCGEPGRQYTSSDSTMYVTFHSDKQTRNGFKLSYKASGYVLSRSSTALTVGIIIGSVILVVLVFSVVICCCCCCKERKKKAPSDSDSESDIPGGEKRAAQPLIHVGQKFAKDSKMPSGSLIPSAPPMEDETGIDNSGFTFGDDHSSVPHCNKDRKIQPIYPALPNTHDLQKSVTVVDYLQREEMNQRDRGQNYEKGTHQKPGRIPGYPVQQIQEIALAQEGVPVHYQKHLGRSLEPSACPKDHLQVEEIENNLSLMEKRNFKQQNQSDHMNDSGPIRGAEVERMQNTENDPMRSVEIIHYGGAGGGRRGKKDGKMKKKKKKKNIDEKIAEPLKQSLKNLSSIECSEMECCEEMYDHTISHALQERHQVQTNPCSDLVFQHPTEPLSHVPFILSPSAYLSPTYRQPVPDVLTDYRYPDQSCQQPWLPYHEIHQQQPSEPESSLRREENHYVIQAEVHSPTLDINQRPESTFHFPKLHDKPCIFNVSSDQWSSYPKPEDNVSMYPVMDTVNSSSNIALTWPQLGQEPVANKERFALNNSDCDPQMIWSINQPMLIPHVPSSVDRTNGFERQSWFKPPISANIRHVPMLVPIPDNNSYPSGDQNQDPYTCTIDMSLADEEVTPGVVTNVEDTEVKTVENDEGSTDPIPAPPDPANLSILLPSHWITDNTPADVAVQDDDDNRTPLNQTSLPAEVDTESDKMATNVTDMLSTVAKGKNLTASTLSSTTESACQTDIPVETTLNQSPLPGIVTGSGKVITADTDKVFTDTDENKADVSIPGSEDQTSSSGVPSDTPLQTQEQTTYEHVMTADTEECPTQKRKLKSSTFEDRQSDELVKRNTVLMSRVEDEELAADDDMEKKHQKVPEVQRGFAGGDEFLVDNAANQDKELDSNCSAHDKHLKKIEVLLERGFTNEDVGHMDETVV